MKSLLLLCAPLLFAASLVYSDTYDTIIRNGRVIDGAGNPPIFADVAIKDGRIQAIGKISGSAAKELDARGLAVAPGFIDVHTHAENIERFPSAENFLRMGVTTLILGNCGGSRLDLDSYFDELTKEGFSPNLASLVGHGTIRSEVIGPTTDRAPTPEELEEMKALVDRAMRAGAVGLSTGLIYLPGTFSETAEIAELAKIVARYDGIYVSHMRNEGHGIFGAIDELLEIAREANVRAQLSHIKLGGNIAWDRAGEVLAALEKARAEGIDLTQDQYLYTASSTSLSQLVPREAREGGREKFRERIADPERKKAIKAQMIAGLERTGRSDYSYAAIASCRSDPSLNGLRVPAAAARRLGSDNIEAQLDLILEIESEGGAAGVFHGMHEDDLRVFLQHPSTMFAADSSVREFGAGVPHPRGYGNNARLLSRYVRGEALLRLEEAVRKMSSLPATTFRLKNRGQLTEGYWADIVVFDPETVQDNATFEEPHQYSTGFRYVLVNGEVVVENDEHTQARPGKILRHEPL